MRASVARLLGAAGLVVAALATPAAAMADIPAVDCMPSPPLEEALAEAELAFVGRVTETSDGGRTARVAVDEVWRGEAPATVTVSGGFDVDGPMEDDRQFEPGDKYLFLPHGSNGPDALIDSICSATTLWSDDLGVLRPADVTAPTSSGEVASPFAFLGDLVAPVAMVAIVGGGAVGLAFLVARRREA